MESNSRRLCVTTLSPGESGRIAFVTARWCQAQPTSSDLLSFTAYQTIAFNAEPNIQESNNFSLLAQPSWQILVCAFTNVDLADVDANAKATIGSQWSPTAARIFEPTVLQT